ncbi:MAG: hypothetical protein WHS65_10130 [Melioribacteraceae bacterium]
MEQMAKIIGKVLLDTIEEAENIYEAIDIYSTRLYKKIILKDNANIDYREDLDTFLFLQGYRSIIADMIFKEELKKEKSI